MEQPDIFDIEALRGASESGLGASAMPQNPAARGTPGAGDADALLTGDVDRDGAKKSGKKKLRPCVGSQFTAASLRQSLDDAVGLSTVKEQLWDRILLSISSEREAGAGGGAESLSVAGKTLLESFHQAATDAKDAARKVLRVADTTRAQLDVACTGVYGVSVR